jgi:hypothetical protein
VGVAIMAAVLFAFLAINWGRYFIAASLVLLLRRPGFAWWRFKQVFAWLLLAYLVVGGMIVYAFVYDHTHGSTLAVLTLLRS